MYRYSEKIRLNLTMGEEETRGDIQNIHEEVETENEPVPMVPIPLPKPGVVTVEQEEVKPPVSVVPPLSPSLDARVSLQDAEIKNIRATLDGRFEKIESMIQGLSVAPTEDNPGGNPSTSPAIEITTPAVPRGQLSTDERIAELEQRLQNSDASTDPLESLTLEQIKDLVRSQPQELMALANPGNPVGNPGGRVQATDVTLRPIIVMFTTYSQILFEKAVHDGYFEGTLSDFVNFSIEQYFKDRGYNLRFTRDDPVRRRLG